MSFPTKPVFEILLWGKLEVGSTQRKVAQELGYDISTIRRWWAKYKNGESLKGAGPPKKLTKEFALCVKIIKYTM